MLFGPPHYEAKTVHFLSLAQWHIWLGKLTTIPKRHGWTAAGFRRWENERGEKEKNGRK